MIKVKLEGETFSRSFSVDLPETLLHEFCDWLLLASKKRADYGDSVEKVPLLCPSISASDAILVRMSDKIKRLVNIVSKGYAEVSEETIYDTIKDLGIYSLLYLSVRVGELDYVQDKK